jgi:polyhydroxyalkanoate synthesis regulator phasin
VKQAKSVFDVLFSRGSAVVSQVSDHLMKSQAFHDFLDRSVENLYRGKQKVNDAVGHALKTMNVPTRSEFKRAVARIEALERELADRKREPLTPAPPVGKRRPPARRKKTPPAAGGA